MQRWHSPWIVCITPPPPPPPPAFRSAASTHTLWRWLSTWLAPLYREYLQSFLWAAECVLLGLCSDGWVDLSVLWIILTAAQSCNVQNVRFPGDSPVELALKNIIVSHLAGKKTGICRIQQKCVLEDLFQPNWPSLCINLPQMNLVLIFLVTVRSAKFASVCHWTPIALLSIQGL